MTSVDLDGWALRNPNGSGRPDFHEDPMIDRSYQIERTGAAGRSRRLVSGFVTNAAATAGVWTITSSMSGVKTDPRHLNPALRPEEAVSP